MSDDGAASDVRLLLGPVSEGLDTPAVVCARCRRRCLLRWRTAVGGSVVFFLVVFLVVQNGYDRQSARWHWPLQNDVKEDVKVILLWTPFFSVKDYGFGVGRRDPFIQAGCRPTVDCETTTDRSRLSEADALVFHIRNTDRQDMPPRDSSNWHQRYVFFLMESPDNTERDLRLYDGVFNWTMTYRLDSDIVAPYFEVIRRRRRRHGLSSNRTRRQLTPTEDNGDEPKAFVSWLASNCHTARHREQYVEELRRHVAVDVYGGCGRPCNDLCERIVFGHANNKSRSGYKFYLAFENSVCRDYVTEKMANALRHGIVPVVYGGADYDLVTPPGSYIDVRRFESPRHLARYLTALKNNVSEYESHLKWMSEYEVDGGGSPVIDRAFCRLCAKLHETNNRTVPATSVYDDIHAWWTLSGNCSHSPLTVS